MLHSWLMPQLTEHDNTFIFHVDGSPLLFHRSVPEFLNAALPNRCTGRDGTADEKWIKWLPHSPDNFCLWGYVKGKVCVPPLLLDIVELKSRTITAF
jgi:hypothetical protein